MQIGGLGGHDSDSHHVTNCHFDHRQSKVPSGSVRLQASETSAAQQLTESLADEKFSLTDWMKNLLQQGKTIWGHIWGENTALQDGEATSSASEAAGSAMQGMSVSDSSHRQAPDRMKEVSDQVNPYFVVPENKPLPITAGWKQFRRKVVQVLRGNLAKQRPADTNTFQPGKHRSKEDQRRLSKFRKDNEEIECILTDDSYLMDSYDKEGNYSKLTVGRK